MKWLSNYRLGFEPWGLALFALVMLPNLYWSAAPAPNDVLRGESSTQVLDAAASVCQALFVAALCLVVRRDRQKVRLSPWIVGAALSAALYFAGWAFYYGGAVNAGVILCLCAAPCLSFLCFAADRKNGVAAAPLAAFTVCHILYGILNFLR